MEGDQGGGQVEVGIDVGASPFGAAAELAEVVEPGVRALDNPPLAHLDRRRFPAVSDLAEQPALVEGVAAGR
jgi:hypothetical protein